MYLRYRHQSIRRETLLRILEYQGLDWHLSYRQDFRHHLLLDVSLRHAPVSLLEVAIPAQLNIDRKLQVSNYRLPPLAHQLDPIHLHRQ